MLKGLSLIFAVCSNKGPGSMLNKPNLRRTGSRLEFDIFIFYKQRLRLDKQ